MLHLNERIKSLVALGTVLESQLAQIKKSKTGELDSLITNVGIQNPWFTREAVIQSLTAIQGWLTYEELNKWIAPYYLGEPVTIKRIAVIMAGNIPMVNFHDFLSVIITGHVFIGKLSSQDKLLLPWMAGELVKINEGWKEQIKFTYERLSDFDAVIATGSTNTSRYFEHYFGKYPNIIRRNRQSLAVLTGNESKEEILKLHNDIFQYYGMGCRNVSMLWVPQEYDFKHLFDTWQELPKPTDHNKYLNNYDYYRSFYLVNQQPFYDTGYVSVLMNESLASPVSVIHYMIYRDVEEVKKFVENNSGNIQCIVAQNGLISSSVEFGKAQDPGLNDYPDGVDIIQFLLAL